jgi:acetylornithine deacetylase
MQLYELTRTLVNIESITGNEGACAAFLRDYLAERKFAVELQPVGPGRANVLACRGTPEIVLSTHLDTVPPFFPAHEDEEFIYGRGACDAKGIVAAELCAAERLISEGVEDFGLLFLVGEETVSDGARVANRSPRGAKYIINGEPTENKLALASKGILQVDIRVKGKAAHSAYPQLGDSAVEKLLDILAEVRQLPMPHDRLLGYSTFSIGMISGGRAANVIPDEAQAQVLIRTVDGAQETRAHLGRLLAGRCEYEFVRDTPVLKMEKIDGYETDVVAFTTDLPHLTRWGRPLLLGPGSVGEAHTDHERVQKAELVRAVELYCGLVCELKRRTIEN